MSRSTLNLVGAAVTGENVGGGIGFFTGKTFINNLQFNTLSGGSGIELIANNNVITISAGTSGGGSVSATNGVCVNGGGEVGLGGTLSQNTTITTNGNVLNIDGQLSITGNPINYADDYSTLYVDRSLIDL